MHFADSQNRDEIVVHDYKLIIDRIYKQIENELSVKNAELIKKYDKAPVNESLAEATRSNGFIFRFLSTAKYSVLFLNFGIMLFHSPLCLGSKV